MAKLVLLQGGEATPFSLTGRESTIGRHPDCEVQLHSNMVSRKHARVQRDGGGYVIEDLGSGNGTYVNGQRIEVRTPLGHLDRIKLGPVLLRFESESTLAAGSATESQLAGTGQFLVDLTAEDDDGATIMGSAGHGSGFGMFDVQPEAKLKGILEISRSLAGSTDVGSLLPKILETLLRIFPKADRGCILLKDGESKKMRVATQKNRREDVDESVRLSRTVLNRVLEGKEGILSADASSDARFQASESISSLTIRSVMCVPMLGLDGEPMGVINLDSQNPVNQFKKDDLELLMAVAGQAALSYESTRLLVSHLEKERQDSELRIATKVQQALLPQVMPKVDGYDFYASYHSALAVGGDYYNIIPLKSRKVCIAFGDVAGKGVPGALVMSRLSSVVETTMAFTDDVADAIESINNHMCAHSADGRFVTFILAVIDLDTHAMSLVNAGHMSPVIRKPDGTVESFHEEQIGIPIGILEDYPYEVVTRVIQPGEMLVIVTDGVDEAMNPAGELYTKERVLEFVKAGSPNAARLGIALLEDVRRHAAGRPQNDDITIMAFGRRA
jgi:serine phosphatase RsbU (regulator of sigma subunit)